MPSFSASSDAIASKIFLAVSLEIICVIFMEFSSFKGWINSFSSPAFTFLSIPLLFVFDIYVFGRGNTNNYGFIPVPNDSGVIGKDLKEEDVEVITGRSGITYN